MRSRRRLYIALILLFFFLSLLNLRNKYSPFSPFPRRHAASEVSPPDYWTWDTSSQFRPKTVANPDPKDPCSSFPSHVLQRIQVVLKIGSTEPADRLDAQLSTSTRCISNLIIFSDREYNLGGRPVYDIIADLPPSYMTNNSDFNTYRGLPEDKPGSGWRLDKYKFLPMVERAYQMNPTAEWFVFQEADTYMVWDNLFRLLEHFDPNVPLYMGSPSPGHGLPEGGVTWFAYGGTGVVLSSAAVKRLVTREVGQYGEFVQPSLTERYEDVVKSDCCGDSVLGWVLYEAGIPLSGLWPLFNPHPFHSIPFADAYWCQPIISAHRPHPDEMKEFAKFEVQRGWSKPLIYADIFKHLNLGFITHRDNWDNGNFHGFSEDASSPAHPSYDACAAGCHNHPECFQFTYDSTGVCIFVRTIRLGLKHVDPARKVRLSSGWDLDKINEWARTHKCERPIWVKPSITRIF